VSAFAELEKVNVSGHTEKKGRFTYLSWPFAYSELFKRYPQAEIDVRDWDGFPAVKGPKGWMVCVSVTVEGVRRTQWHPVLDNNNRPIPEPDVFAINTSIQRGTVKAIALHGLGLYIYAGEDLPPEDKPDAITPTAGVAEGLDWEQQKKVDMAYATLMEYVEAGDIKGGAAYVSRAELDTEEKIALWTMLDSKTRSALKAAMREAT
jgi:hypothetical protein